MLFRRFRFLWLRLLLSAVSMLMSITLRGAFISWVESFIKRFSAAILACSGASAVFAK